MIDVDIRQRLGSFRLEVKFALDRRVVGLFGRSGSGKTSLINAIAGISRPAQGHVRIAGTTLFDSALGVDVPSARRGIGYVFQDSLLFPHLSVEDNLLYGHRLRRTSERFIELPQVLGLLGLEPLLRRKPGTLSGGEKQRVAIGRALLAQPRLMLLDEPLAALDGPRKGEILDYIERLRDVLRLPMIYVSHSVPEITRVADALVVMSDGKDIAVGDVQWVMARMDLKPYTGRYEAGALVETTVLAHDTPHQLTRLRFSGGELIVPRLVAKPGEQVRVRIRARDVSIALERPRNISIQNILAGRVLAISDEAGPIVDVQLAVGEETLIARITRRSREELGIVVGQDLYALVKAVTFDRRSTGYA